ncbi:lipopolysaccharide assembly LapA domain-containing protein [Paenarthrobacter nicotinovorans]|uniref:LapA family protein n=1 Tax=Paenarthrobacter nicotinovorans TaxID=29320 RepID=UPI00119F5503|nr:lipopolysaccharide assembly protein LapA domain-containing protein [Paenarthrobacter nicotinovorans]MDP9935978.1 putative integral membrane protein [Paenarthrobacter nicotinovorans]
MSFHDDAARMPVGPDREERGAPPPLASSTRPTRTAALWVAVAVGLVVLVMLIIFFVQNQDMTTVRFFGLEGTLALGTTLFIAAVGGGVLVALAGGARILQLRIADHRRRKIPGGPGAAP